MKKLSLLLALLLMTFSCSIVFGEEVTVAGVQPGNAYIPKDTTFAVQLAEMVNSKSTFAGEVLEVNILEDIVLNNVVVIERGSKGYVVVSEVRQPAEFGKAGGIVLDPQYVKTANWIKVPLMGRVQKSGQGHNAVEFWGGAGTGIEAVAVHKLSEFNPGIGGIFLAYLDFSHGKDAEIPAGTKFFVSVKENVDLQTTPGKLDTTVTASEIRKGVFADHRINWAGTYYTNRGKMILKQGGDKVTGTYETGDGKLEGRIVGDKLIGTWHEKKSETAPTGKGYFEITFSPGGNTVTILWRNDNSDTWTVDQWAARRI